MNKKIVIKMSASPYLRDIRWHVAGAAQTFAPTAISYLFMADPSQEFIVGNVIFFTICKEGLRIKNTKVPVGTINCL